MNRAIITAPTPGGMEKSQKFCFGRVSHTIPAMTASEAADKPNQRPIRRPIDFRSQFAAAQAPIVGSAVDLNLHEFTIAGRTEAFAADHPEIYGTAGHLDPFGFRTGIGRRSGRFQVSRDGVDHRAGGVPVGTFGGEG